MIGEEAESCQLDSLKVNHLLGIILVGVVGARPRCCMGWDRFNILMPIAHQFSSGRKGVPLAAQGSRRCKLIMHSNSNKGGCYHLILKTIDVVSHKRGQIEVYTADLFDFPYCKVGQETTGLDF